MNLTATEEKITTTTTKDKSLQPTQAQVRTEKVFRRNKTSIDKIIEYDMQTGDKLRVLHFDYFNSEKIRAIDEFIPETGQKYRTVNYILFKSIDEFDTETGKKLRTINYDMKDENRVTSIQEYDTEREKIKKVTLFRRDGKTISTIKEINPENENLIKWTSFRETKTISSVSEYNPENGNPAKTTYFYQDGETVREVHDYNPQNGEWKRFIRFDKNKNIIETKLAANYHTAQEEENIAQLIDNLYNKNLCFE